MSRIESPGSVSIRVQLGIRPEDPSIFHPVKLIEAVEIARVLRKDEEIPQEIRDLLEVGIVFDLMPGHRTPKKSDLADLLKVSPRTVRRRELAWEMSDRVRRFDLVHRASRLLVAIRGSR